MPIPSLFAIFLTALTNSVKGKQEVLVQDISKLKQIQEQTQMQAELKNTKAETKASYLTQAQVKDFFNSKISIIHPVGNILITVDSRNPSEYIPGTTWEAWGQGRMIYAVYPCQSVCYIAISAVITKNP